MSTEIDTGDIVHHHPSGEDWMVAYVKGHRVAWCGWPNGEAELKDCVLVHKCDPATRDSLLRDMAKIDGNDSRAVYARDRLRCNAESNGAQHPTRTPGYRAGTAGEK